MIILYEWNMECDLERTGQSKAQHQIAPSPNTKNCFREPLWSKFPNYFSSNSSTAHIHVLIIHSWTRCDTLTAVLKANSSGVQLERNFAC